MTIYFVRHGHTEWNGLGKIQGSVNTELSDIGVAQAHALANRLQETANDSQVGAIYSSPQIRAFHTAEIIAKPLGLSVAPLPGVEEINFGLWEGCTWLELSKQYPTEFLEWTHHRRYYPAPNGESYQQVLERVIPVVSHLSKSHSENIMIVTHGGVMASLKCLIQQAPFEELEKFKVANTEVMPFSLEQLQLAKAYL